MEIADQDRIKAVDGVLTLQNAVEADSGNYTCHVENMAASHSRSAWIIVSGR